MMNASTAPATVPVIRITPRRSEPAPVDINDMKPLIAAHQGESVDRLRDHVADLGEILAHFLGEALHHRKMTVRASAPM